MKKRANKKKYDRQINYKGHTWYLTYVYTSRKPIIRLRVIDHEKNKVRNMVIYRSIEENEIIRNLQKYIDRGYTPFKPLKYIGT